MGKEIFNIINDMAEVHSVFIQGLNACDYLNLELIY